MGRRERGGGFFQADLCWQPCWCMEVKEIHVVFGCYLLIYNVHLTNLHANVSLAWKNPFAPESTWLLQEKDNQPQVYLILGGSDPFTLYTVHGLIEGSVDDGV